MQQNDPSGAIADLRAVLRDQPNSVVLQRSLAAAHVAKGEPRLAEEALRAGMQAAPNDVAVRVDLAQLLASTDRKAEGVTVLEEMVNRLPTTRRRREALLKAYVATGNLQAASASAQELQKRQPQAVAGFYYAGLIAAQEKHLDESQANFESAFKLQPQRTDVLGWLVRVMVQRGQYDAAVAKVRATLAQQPKNYRVADPAGRAVFQP